MDKPILPRSIGFEGADAVNKTRFAKLTTQLLNSYGQEARLVGLPFGMALTGVIIKHAKELGITRETMPLLFATNRAEILRSVKLWIAGSEKRWAVFDRTDKSGKAYALAEKNSVTADEGYLDALDLHFPGVQVGLYLARPVEESAEIMTRRSSGTEISAEKATLDHDLALQAGVRAEFEKMFADDPRWQTIDVSGLANSEEEFVKWENERGREIWRNICSRVGRPEWIEGVEERIDNLRVGVENTPILELWTPTKAEAEIPFAQGMFGRNRERR